MPKSIKEIGYLAFSAAGLTSVVIPDGVTAIDKCLFANCKALTSVKLHKNITSIAESAFSNCESLVSINLPDTLTTIEEYTFYGCNNLTSIHLPSKLTSIGNNAFYGCEKLTSVDFPSGIKSIGNWAFGRCQALTSVTLPSGLTTVENYAFAYSHGIRSVTIPDSVKHLGNGVFEYCISLESLSIPKNLTDIGDSAFRKCELLADKKGFVVINKILFDYAGSSKNVNIPYGITRIAGYALSEKDFMLSVNIPDSVTTIEEQAFGFCWRLTSATIPDSVTSIGEKAFLCCTSLKSLIVPESVTSIGSEAFYGYPTPMETVLMGKKGSYVQKYAQSYDIKFKAITSFPTANKAVLSSDSIVLGNTVTVNCAAKEGTAPYTYAVYYRKEGTSKWTTLQGYKSNSTVTFKPGAAVNYEVRVAVKDASGNIVRKDMPLSVKKPLANTSRLNLSAIKLGEKVKVRCFAENGETPYTFSVQYKKSGTTKWTNLAVNSTNNIFVLKPAAATSYDIRVTAKSSDGQVSKKTLTLTVTK